MRKGILLLLILSILLIPGVSAVVGEEGYCVSAEVSDINPSSIGIGEEFTVGIQIENCGSKMPEDITFEFLNLPTDITIKEHLITNIPSLYKSTSERFLTFHMRTTNNAQPGIHLIKTRLSYRGKEIRGEEIVTADYNIEINIRGDESELSIASLKTDPVLPKEGETVELTMRIENTGDGIAKSVSVYADHQFKGLKQAFIGALDPNEDSPAVLTFIVDEAGEFEFPVTISYRDDFGKQQIETKVSLIVLEVDDKSGKIAITVLIIVVIGGLIYYNYRTRKKKDKIIRQLMRGHDHSDKKKK